MKNILFLNTIHCKAWKNRALFLMLALVMSVGNAWATDYYTKATVAVKTGSGTVYVGTSTTYSANTTTATAAAATNKTEKKNEEQTYYINAVPATDYRFDKWEFSNWSTNPRTSKATTSGKVEAISSTENNPSTGTAQATFLPISIASVEPTSVPLNPTDARTLCSDYTGSVLFTTTNDNAASQIGAPTFTKTGSGMWTFSNDWAAGTSTVTYTFKGNGYYGGSGTSSGSRSNSATLTLPTAGGTSSKSVNFTANFPSLVLSDATENNTAYPINPTSDGTGSVVFPVQYCDGAFDFTATITGASGGTFTLGTISFTQTNAATGSGNITVPFTFNAGGAVGDFSATLTLTPQANTGGTAKSVTITAYAEAEAKNDVSVTTAGGVTTEYATWAEGLAAANANAGCTLTLLRNIDLTGTYGITATQGITQTMTLDLNSWTLSASIGGPILNPKTAGKTLTIKDSKTGGRIQNITPDYNGITYGVNISAGTVNLESGTIYAENQKQYNYGTSSIGGTASNATAVEVRAVRLVAGAKFNMSGGKVEAHGTRAVRAIYQESSKANTTEVNISGGEVYAEAPSYVYGILAYGKVNISGTAQINVKINDGLVNGNATYQSSKFDSYTLHRYGYGIYMTAYANKTPSACYFGTLTMTGGTINVENVNKTLNGTSLNTEHTYGIYMGIASAGMGNANGEATDGTNTQKASSIGSIENTTINVTHEGVQVYGVDVLGCYNSFNKTTTPFTIKNSTINVTGWQTVYGVLSDVSIDWSNSLTTFTGTGRCSAGNIELTNTTINATTTGGTGAYCAWASATYGTVADAKANTGAQSTGNATYKGEYAVAATLTINSGTYTANAATSSAYAVGSSDRAKTIRNIRGSIISRDASTDSNGSLGGNAEAYPELYIHGGTFKAKTLSAGTARAVKSGGTTVIDGGTFEADAATSSSVAIAVHSGKTTVSGVTMTAYANTDANAVYVPATVSDYSLFDYAGEVELNNCVATVVTRTAENARGVYVNSTTRTYTLAQFNTAKEANNSTYKTYGDYWQVGAKAISGKATINGGSYTVKSATKNAYGVLLTTNALSTDGTAKADGEIIARNATFNVQTLNGATAYGIQAGGKATVDGCNLTVTASTSDARGVYSLDEKTIVKNSTITTTTSTSGSYGTIGSAVVASNGVERVADFELSGNTISSTAGTETAYAIYMTGVSGGPYATDYFTGSMALAATAVVNSGTYSANASTKTAYAAGVADPLLKNEATATPTLIINDGKFKGTGDAAPFADVSLAGEPGYFVLNGGYYVKDENLDKKLGEGMNKVAVQSGTPEYTEDYRWRVTDNMTGEYVCKIKENSTSYASLEEALQVVNADPNSPWTIIMIANYTLSKGDYVLPANTTLLIPYQSSQTAINGATPKYTSPNENVEQYEAPSPLYKLTFANGVNMSVYGKIEASAVTYLSNQGLTTHGTGVVSGKYGWLYLNEGSHIDLESGSALYAWGYVTGKGEINAKNGSSVYEDFQMGDWRGGTEASNVNGNKYGLDEKGVFLITHYYYQNIECPITYRAGAQGMAHSGTYVYKDLGILGKIEQNAPTGDAVKMIGTSDAMFLMDPATAGEDTWVRKEYDPETDYVNWTLNSGAKLGSVSLKISATGININLSSSDYVLPITSNFNIIANDGEIQITNHVCFIPGSKLTIKKEGTLTIPSGQRVFFYDQDNWLSYGGYWFNPYYSPSWKVNPRVATIGKNTSVKMPDAEVLVEGLLNVNGAIYTTAGGANIHSTRENAGKVKFNVALPAATAATGETTGSTTLYQWKAGGPKYDGKALNPAWLKNEDGTYSKPTSENTSADDTWVYMQSLTSDTYEWTKASEDGCFTIRSTDDTKTYVHPSDWVAVGDVNANHAYPSKDGTRMFVNTEAASTSASCKWWDVNKTPEVIDGTTYYVANNENFDNFGTYYYWDNTTSYWKPKKITVTWLNEDGTKITNGTYGDEYNFNTSPQFFGTNPKKTPTAIEKYDWIGWRDAEGNIYDKNATLPRATSNVTYTAYFNTTKYQYTITFKNDDNSDLWAGLVDAGTTGAELQALFETKYNEKTGSTVPQKAPTVDKVFTFAGWNTTLATVSGPATYVAQYNATPRKYAVTFMNYDMSVLGTAEVPYGSTPTRATYLEAVAPLKDDPYKPDNSAYLFEFAGWRLYGASSNGFVPVAGDQMYIAQYNQTKKYLIQILDIVDADNTENSLTINATSFALSGWPYTINDVEYARPADRMLTIPYGDKDPNEEIVIEVKDKEGTVVSYNMYIVPFVYTSDATLSGTDENSIVFVKSDTLTVGTASAKEIYVAPGAALKVKENSTLDVKKLVLRTTPFEAAILTNKGTIVGQVYYSRIARDTDFHLFAIPAGSNTAGVVLSDGTSAAVASTVAPYGAAWQLREYNTARRAEAGDDGANWNNIGVNGDGKTYSDVAIKASKGYELRSGSKYYREYLFPVTLPTATTSVGVIAATGAAGAAHAGWNILCSPYTYIYTAVYNDPARGIKVSWQKQELDGSYSYIQVQPDQIKPAVPFAYQAMENGSLDFSADSLFFKAPRKQSAAEALTETEWVHLDIFDAYGEGDETSLFVHPTRFEQTYKTGIDMAKQSLTASRPIIYSTHAYGDMAFAGVADSLLENGIDLVVYSPSAQELTFSLRENKFLNRLEYLWLADNETGERTDLLMDDYTCRADAGTAKGRFVLNGRFKAPQISTGIGNTQTDYNIYAIGNNIAISGVEQGTPIYVFDAVGHMIYTTAATSDEVIVPAPCAGVYMLSVGGQTAKLVINQ